MADTRQKGYLTQAWLVLVLAGGFGGALAAVNLTLKDQIAANKLNETLERIPDLVPGAQAGVKAEVSGRTVYRAVDAGGMQAGWVVPASGQGFAGRVEVLIGLDDRVERITGLYVLDQKETPGLGNKITTGGFQSQFAGKSAAAALVVVKGAASGNEIQAISGATISSKSVCDIVNKTTEELAAALRAAGPAEAANDEK